MLKYAICFGLMIGSGIVGWNANSLTKFSIVLKDDAMIKNVELVPWQGYTFISKGKNVTIADSALKVDYSFK